MTKNLIPVVELRARYKELKKFEVSKLIDKVAANIEEAILSCNHTCEVNCETFELAVITEVIAKLQSLGYVASSNRNSIKISWELK